MVYFLVFSSVVPVLCGDVYVSFARSSSPLYVSVSFMVLLLFSKSSSSSSSSSSYFFLSSSSKWPLLVLLLFIFLDSSSSLLSWISFFSVSLSSVSEGFRSVFPIDAAHVLGHNLMARMNV